MSYFDPFGITTRVDPLDPWSDIGLGFGDWSSWGMPSGSYFDPLFGMMTGAGLNDPRRSPRKQTQVKRAAESAKTETKTETRAAAAAPAAATCPSTCAQTTTASSTSELQQPQQPLSTDKDKEKEKEKEQEREREQAGQQKEPEVPQPQQPLQVPVQGVLPQQAQQATVAQQVQQQGPGASTEEEEDAPIKRLAVRAHQRPTIDISESSDEYTLVVDFPGVRKEDLKVVVSGNSLSITGERKVPAGMDLKGKANKSFRRAFGKFARTLQLPPHTDPNKVKAKYENGVLTVDIPKSRLDDSKLPRAIDVQ